MTALVPACGDDDPSAITLVTYDSFPASDTSLNEALDAFTEDTGIDVELLVAGDTGTMVSKAVLTAGNPEGDVMFGVDNTFLSRVVEEDVFEPYDAEGLDSVPDEVRALVPDGEATPVDFGDVCINYDIAWFEEQGLDPPADLAALADPAYADLLVVENPATSSPGLAFVLATIAEFGEDGWIDYWAQLRDNGVEVVDGWTEAYYERFSGASDGPKPLVVSYGTSPPAEVVFADPPIDAATTAAIDTTCFRQVEFAGVLRGTEHGDEAAPAGRLPALRALPGRAAAEPVRVPGERRRRRCRRCSPRTPRCPPIRSASTRPRSPPTGRPGSPSGPTPSCADPPSGRDPSQQNRLPGRSSPPAGRRAGRRSSPCSTPGRSPRCWPAASRRTAVADTLGRSVTWDIAWFTLWQAVVSTVLTIGVGLGPAYVLARYRFAGRRLLASLLTAAFVLPTVVMGAAVLALLPAGWERGVPAILAAHVVFNLAVVVRTVGAVWEHLPGDLEAAAATLGASPWRAFREITLPLLRPAILAAASIVFVFTFTSFGVIRVLGDAGTSTIEVEIWRQATQLGNLGTAATLAVLQLAAVGARRRLDDVAAAAPQPGARPPTARPALPSAARPPAVPGGGGRRRHGGSSSSRPSWRSSSARCAAATATRSARWRTLGRAEVRPGIGVGIDPVASIAASLRTTAVATVVAVVIGLLAALAITGARRGRATARHRADAADRHVSGDDRLRPADHVRHPARRLARRRGGSCRSARRSSPCRSSSAPCCPCCAASTPTCTRRRRRSAPPRAGRGGRSPCRTCAARRSPRPGSPRRSRSASSVPPASSPAAATTTMPIAIDRLLGRAGTLLQAQGYALATILAAVTVVLVLVVDVAGGGDRRD